MFNLAVSCAIIFIIIAGAVWARHRDLLKFNKGICERCNNKYKTIARSSQGDSLWVCENERCENNKVENSFWTSWIRKKHIR